MSDKNVEGNEQLENDPATPADELEHDAGARDDGDNVADNDDDEEDVPVAKQDGTYSKAEFEKAAKRRQAALDRARKAEKELNELRKATATKEQKLQMEAEEKAKAQADRFKPALVRQHVAYEMAFLGLNKTQINQVVKFVEMDNIDVDLEDNSVEGVESEVARIREIFPDLFPNEEETPAARAARKNAPKKRVAKVDGADKPPPPKPQTARDKLRARLHKG